MYVNALHEIAVLEIRCWKTRGGITAAVAKSVKYERDIKKVGNILMILKKKGK